MVLAVNQATCLARPLHPWRPRDQGAGRARGARAEGDTWWRDGSATGKSAAAPEPGFRAGCQGAPLPGPPERAGQRRQLGLGR